MRGKKAGHKTPAFAVPGEQVSLLIMVAIEKRDECLAAGAYLDAIAAFLDATWMALMFMGCMRKSKANSWCDNVHKFGRRGPGRHIGMLVVN